MITGLTLLNEPSSPMGGLSRKAKLSDRLAFANHAISFANSITQQLLQEHFDYRDGHLFWVKPTSDRVKVGQQFGSCDKKGYRQGSFKSKMYKEHRLIWLYHHGEWPKDQLDHTNRIKDDNRIENLREVTNQQNQFNRKSYGKTSKYKGVHWSKNSKKWMARYRYNGKKYYLGLYECELEAAAAYDKATEHLHGEFALTNFA